MNQNQQQYLQQAVQVLKEHGMEVNVVNIMHFINNAINEDIVREWLEAQLEEQAWAVYQAEEGKPAEDEEFGEPNAEYCNSAEPGHNGGWFCYHPACVTSPDDTEAELRALDRLDQYLAGDEEAQDV